MRHRFVTSALRQGAEPQADGCVDLIRRCHGGRALFTLLDVDRLRDPRAQALLAVGFNPGTDHEDAGAFRFGDGHARMLRRPPSPNRHLLVKLAISEAISGDGSRPSSSSSSLR